MIPYEKKNEGARKDCAYTHKHPHFKMMRTKLKDKRMCISMH